MVPSFETLRTEQLLTLNHIQDSVKQQVISSEKTTFLGAASVERSKQKARENSLFFFSSYKKWYTKMGLTFFSTNNFSSKLLSACQKLRIKGGKKNSRFGVGFRGIEGRKTVLDPSYELGGQVTIQHSEITHNSNVGLTPEESLVPTETKATEGILLRPIHETLSTTIYHTSN